MDLATNLIRARSHIIFMLAIISAFSLVIFLENIELETQVAPRKNIRDTVELKLAEQRPLTATEMQWARIAWKYFENNTIDESGMVNSVNNYTATTLWDSASYFLGLISAYRIDLINEAEFDRRVKKLLDSLAKLPLFDGRLPNKVYNTRTLAMVDYSNKEIPQGIGWSAIDVGRILVPLNILVWHYPQYTQQVRQIMDAWKFTDIVRKGEMYGATNENGLTEYLQEGRLGYEEYAAKTFQLMGLDVGTAIDYTLWLKFKTIEGINIPTDSRSPDKFTANNYVVSEPYILDGVEFGWDAVSQEFAERVYAVQEKRYQSSGILTAVSEDNIDQPPYFVYNTVFSNGKAWNAITESGEDASAFKTLSTKAAFGWHSLFESDYTRQLMEVAGTLHDPDNGWYSGRYEKTGKTNTALTANTNGIILEVLAYKQNGPLLKP